MNAYSEDLRMKIVEALERGMGNSQAARTFSAVVAQVEPTPRVSSGARPLDETAPVGSPLSGSQ
jgi:hypothetical protein